MSIPIYAGCAILDLSKLTILEFQYNAIKQHFKHNYTVP